MALLTAIRRGCNDDCSQYLIVKGKANMLYITTCQAENTFAITRQLAAYLSAQIDETVHCVDEISWEERYRRLDAGEIDIGWICGYPYILRAAAPDARLALLAAPVMAGERYQSRPCYFSDVVVQMHSPYQQFQDLRGLTWAVNEPGSHSGYNVTRYHLAQLEETDGYFGRVVASGGHMRSINQVLAGEVDASAIDSTVWEWAQSQQPALTDQLRVIETIGPSPIPPLVIQNRVPAALVDHIRTLLLHLHEDTHGRDLLAQAGLKKFTAVTDADYDPIRTMAQEAARVTWAI